MIKEVDVDGDGRIDFYEFVHALGEPEDSQEIDEDIEEENTTSPLPTPKSVVSMTYDWTNPAAIWQLKTKKINENTKVIKMYDNKIANKQILQKNYFASQKLVVLSSWQHIKQKLS